jgi:hypothetical protein
MKLRGFLLGTAVVAGAAAGIIVVLNRRHEAWDRQMRESSKTFGAPASSSTIEELSNDFPENTSRIPAFEDALEVETRLEQQLARETGLET